MRSGPPSEPVVWIESEPVILIDVRALATVRINDHGALPDKNKSLKTVESKIRRPPTTLPTPIEAIV